MKHLKLLAVGCLLGCLPVFWTGCQTSTSTSVSSVWPPEGTETTVIEQTYSDGAQRLVVSYIDNQKVGMKEFYEHGGVMQTGAYAATGEREGLWKYWYRNGKLNVECSYKNGLRHGKHTVYYDNGFKRFEGMNREGERTGIWEFWDQRGTLEKQFDYDQDGIQVFP